MSFGFPVDRESAEGLLAVKDFAGAVPGRRLWEGDTLRFVPEPPLKPGCRYIFSFSGVFRNRRGAEIEYHHIVPFFHERRDDTGLHLVSLEPASGTFVSPDREILLCFSRSVDPVSFELYFRLNPSREHTVEWRDDFRTAGIRAVEGWENLTLYTLSFGGLLDEGRNLVFLVQEDVESPRVAAVEAALDDGSFLFPPAGDVRDSLTHRDAIRITFSEAMDGRKTRDAVSLDPYTPGDWFWLDGMTLIFRPESGYIAGRPYSLSVGSSAEDAHGNGLAYFPPVSFIPDIALLDVSVEFAGDGIVLASGELSPSLPRDITLTPAGSDYTFIITFTGGLFETNDEKLSAHEGIGISCVFPPAAPSPVPTGRSWTGDRRLSITWTGFSPGTDGREFYYLLTLRGGPDGVRTGEGNILPAGLEQLIRTGQQ